MNILIKDTQILVSGDKAPVFGGIGIEDGLIKHVGDIPPCFTPDTVIEGSNFIAMPGLVNAHTHSPMGLLRNMADDLPFDEWLFNKIIPAEAKLDESDIYWGAMLGIAEMIKSGTTCFADMYLHMDRIAAAVVDTGIRANLSYGPITSGVRGEGLIVDEAKCSSFIKKWNNNDNSLIKAFLEIHSVYLFDRQSITEAAKLAKELNTGIHIHLSESDAEIGMSMEKYGMTPIEAAYDMGIFNSPVIAAHCVKLTDNDIKILRENNVCAVHNPSSNLKLGNGFAPVSRLIKEGVNVALGTDGAASNNNLNLFEEMHLAALIHKGTDKDPQSVGAKSVINMAAVNGAKALGFQNLGELAIGNKADIILIDINKPHICPVNDIKSAVVYSAMASDVDTVIINGKILMKNRELTTIDEELVMSKVKHSSKKLKS